MPREVLKKRIRWLVKEAGVAPSQIAEVHTKCLLENQNEAGYSRCMDERLTPRKIKEAYDYADER